MRRIFFGGKKSVLVNSDDHFDSLITEKRNKKKWDWKILKREIKMRKSKLREDEESHFLGIISAFIKYDKMRWKQDLAQQVMLNF